TIEVNALEYNDAPFDRILTDTPCLGSGTLSKKPDIKWKKDLFDLRKISDLQYELLVKASTLLKTGGVMVYSTCSIEPEENFEIVKKFLNNHPQFKLKDASEVLPKELADEHGCIQTLPHIHHMDGAFAAKLVKEE
ncbi:MAG: 16S rRNA (cytosine(967)-C(5))-methyltransferase RsmB, partial [Ignavibacteriaceae bacterium]